ncbi:MAG: hypothetical protein ACOCXQ_03405 [Patescibacteria group bacterium]
MENLILVFLLVCIVLVIVFVVYLYLQRGGVSNGDYLFVEEQDIFDGTPQGDFYYPDVDGEDVKKTTQVINIGNARLSRFLNEIRSAQEDNATTIWIAQTRSKFGLVRYDPTSKTVTIVGQSNNVTRSKKALLQIYILPAEPFVAYVSQVKGPYSSGDTNLGLGTGLRISGRSS